MLLNPKQLKFCQEYLKSGNATEAYAIAYKVNDKVANANGCRLLANTSIKAYIESFQKAMQEQTKITVESVLKGIHEIATKDTAKDADKLKAYSLLGEYLGMFSNKQPAAALPPVTEQDETERK
jgi:phage terminase small subunit